MQRITPDALPLPTALERPRVAGGVGALVLALSIALAALPGYREYRTYAQHRAEITAAREGVRDLDRETSAVIAAPDAAHHMTSGALAARLATSAGAYGIEVRDFPQPKELPVSEEIDLESYRLELSGGFADVLRYVRDLELADDPAGAGTGLGPYSVVHLETGVVRDRATRRHELRSRLVVRRLTELAP